MQKLRSLDDIGAMLEATGRFKVLRRVPEALARSEAEAGGVTAFVGIALQTSATPDGSDPSDPLEIAMIKFAYDPANGRVLRVLDEFRGQRSGRDDPGTAAIAPGAIEAFLDEVNLIVALPADAHRPIVEAAWPDAFGSKPWACAAQTIDAPDDGRRLKDVLASIGFFHDGTGTTADAKALLHVMAGPLRGSSRPALATVLECARKSSDLIFAEDAPAEAAGILRDRGYAWSRGDAGVPACWHRDVADADEELAWLAAHVYLGRGRGPSRVRLTARNRYRRAEILATGRVAAWSTAADLEP